MFETRRRTAPLGAHGLAFLVEVADAAGEATALFTRTTMEGWRTRWR
jgi:hypothetical protein